MRTSPPSWSVRPGAGTAAFAAVLAFLERAAVLTPDLAKRSARALAAAQAKVQAGAVDAGLDLLAMAEAGPLGEFERARADLVRAQIAWVTRRGRATRRYWS